MKELRNKLVSIGKAKNYAIGVWNWTGVTEENMQVLYKALQVTDSSCDEYRFVDLGSGIMSWIDASTGESKMIEPGEVLVFGESGLVDSIPLYLLYSLFEQVSDTEYYSTGAPVFKSKIPYVKFHNLNNMDFNRTSECEEIFNTNSFGTVMVKDTQLCDDDGAVIEDRKYFDYVLTEDVMGNRISTLNQFDYGSSMVFYDGTQYVETTKHYFDILFDDVSETVEDIDVEMCRLCYSISGHSWFEDNHLKFHKRDVFVTYIEGGSENE